MNDLATSDVASAEETPSRRKRHHLLRIAFGGLVATALALGLVVGGIAPAAVAKSSYVTKKYIRASYGDTSQAVRNVQLRLADIGQLSDRYVTGYYGDLTKGAIKGFRRSAGMKAGKGTTVTKKTWKALVRTSGKVKIPGGNSGSKIDSRCLTGGRVLCIDKSKQKFYYVNHNKIIKTMDARFGCSGSATREGTFTVFRKVRDDWSYLYDSAMPYSMYFSGGQAVHYSSDFAARGYAGCSHGCVNIRDRKDLRYVYKRIRTGDRVVVYWS